MEVRCSNCSTEYEFDDALVSARGTSVKCTNCGHQFRVHAPGAAAPGGPEKWAVRDARGKETTFTSLRELQQAIVRGAVDQKHEMSHAGGPFRPLQDIYELQSFFDAARKRVTQQRQPPRTLLGVGHDILSQPIRQSAPPPRRTSVPPPRKRPLDAVSSPDRASQEAASQEPAAAEELGSTERVPRQRSPLQDRLTPVAGVPAMQSIPYPKVDPPLSPGETRTLSESGSRPAPRMSTPGPLGAVIDGTLLPGERSAGERPPGERFSSPPDRYSSAGERLSSPFDPPIPGPPVVPWQNLQGLRDEADLEALGHRRGAGLRWILAVVVVGGLALVGATVGRDYFVRYIRREPEKPVVDQRVPALLEQARSAFARGDFEGMHGALSKASVLAETDPGVAVGVAKLEVARAEPAWLIQRVNAVLDAAAAERDKEKDKPPKRRKPTDAEIAAENEAAQKKAFERKQLELSFQDRLKQIKTAVASANFRAPTAPDTIRARVDELRLEGQLKEARALLAPVSGSTGDPETAFTLGALDVAEGESGYASAIERLRSAARTEEGLGRARALLIFALAQTGDAAAASAELEKLQTLAPQHPALASLRSLLELAQSKQAPPEEPRRPIARAQSAPSQRPASANVAAAATNSANNSSSGGEDVQSLLSQAGTLQRSGDIDGAERIYQGILTRSPKNIPALSGLADIARQRKAIITATNLYDQILKIDRNHVPTLMSRADLYWGAGNRILAVALYRRALGQVGPSDPVGQRALARIEQYEKEGAGEATGGSNGTNTTGPAEEKDVPLNAAPAAPPSTAPSPSSPPSGSTGSSGSPTPAPSNPAPSNPAPSNPAPGNPAPSTDGNAPRPNPRFPPPPIPTPPHQSAPPPGQDPARAAPPAPDGTGNAPANP
jgi:predicted Zn finger-like uncharacterized protein